MAIKFAAVSGSAKKSSVKWFQFSEGINRFRMVGDILPMYVYWKLNNKKKNLPIECLAFDRAEEKFTNIEYDWFRHYFPDAKCQWSYAVKAFDAEGNLCTVNLKKKMFKQIQDAAETLGDPTHAENGWEVVVKREKTGPANFNVEYTLQVLKCKKLPLTEEQVEVLKNSPTIEEELPRPSSQEQQVFIKNNFLHVEEKEEEDEKVAEEAIKEVGEYLGHNDDDDIPY